MARIESVALAGFYKTQDEVLPLIFAHFVPTAEPGKYCVVDPCAGEGAAVAAFTLHVFGPMNNGTRRESADVRIYKSTPFVDVDVYAVELEQERYWKAKRAIQTVSEKSYGNVEKADALCVTYSKSEEAQGATVLFLNPPYDIVRGKRLELQFLRRWAPCLAVGGHLVLIVPEHVLPLLTPELTPWYDDLEVLRYPEPVYSDFKQVVVLGTRRALPGALGPLPATTVLGEDIVRPRVLLGGLRHGLASMDVQRMDVAGVLGQTKAWQGLAGYDRPAQPQRVGLAMRPKPAHVAMALGSGIFNGMRLTAPGRPDLLAKAIFVRTWIDADEKKNEHGETVKLVQVERPKLRITTLHLGTGEYAELDPGTKPSDTGEIKNFADLLLAYGDSMIGAMRERCPSLHDGQEDALQPMTRKLYSAQEHAVRAALKLLYRGQTPLVLGEVGSGKTACAIQVMWELHQKAFKAPTHEAFDPVRTLATVRRVLVVCPPHLCQNWVDEMKACLPWVPVRELRSVLDVDAVAQDTAPLLVAVLSRETAKLGCTLAGVGTNKCPKCGTRLDIGAEKLAATRTTCTASSRNPQDALTRIALDMFKLSQQWGKKRSVQAVDRNVPMVMLRRRALVALLRKLALNRTYTSYSKSFSVKADYEVQQKLVAAIKCCQSTDPRVSRILSRLYSQPHQTAMRDATPKHDDQALFQALWSLGKWGPSLVCGEPLYQAVPAPRRWPLADYICKKHPALFQMIIPDEFHEYSSANSAQGFALHRLTECIPIALPLTGSLMNGYAKSLFTNLWAISRRMRAEFAYSEAGRFARTYGYQKRVLTGDALKEAKVTERGSTTDRVAKTEGGERLSEAPGVLPSFVLRHILPLSIALHKRDIMPDERVVDHDRVELPVTGELARNGAYLGAALKEAVKRDRYDKDLAGKLFGQLAEYPSYFDRATADTGNAGATADRRFDIQYPEDVGGAIVASAAGLPVSDWMAKEAWLLSLLRRELDEGRNVLVGLWHTELAERLQKLVKAAGEVPAFLDAKKVKARDRQTWIDKNVVGKRRVMIVNPTCVMTGLNNLIWFSTGVFMENPACNPFVARQFVGRLDRITQTKEVRIFWPVYEGMQAKMLDLLQAKTAIAQQIDGIDPTAALEMAGAGDSDQTATQDIGLAVYKFLGGD